MGKGKRNKEKRKLKLIETEFLGDDIVVYRENVEKIYGSNVGNINNYTYDEFYESGLTTRMRNSIKNELKNMNDELIDQKFKDWDMEYCWWGSYCIFDYFDPIVKEHRFWLQKGNVKYSDNLESLHLLDVKMEELNKNYQKNYWIDEDDYISFKINAKTNKTPDYIIKNIKNNKLIGLEVSSAQFPMLSKTSKIDGLIKNFQKRVNQNMNSLDRIKEVIDKKTSKKFVNWEKVDEKGLIITFEGEISTFDLENLYIEAIKYNDSKEYKFDYLLIAFGG